MVLKISSNRTLKLITPHYQKWFGTILALYLGMNDIALLPLSGKYGQGKWALVLLSDVERLSVVKWYVARKSNNISCSIGNNGKNVRQSLASWVMNKPGKMFDHRNRNPFNNLPDNLRECTYDQNAQNNQKHYGASKYKGVSYHKRDKKWQASIMCCSKNKHIGSFELEVSAALAYNKWALKLHGEFAVLNNVDI